MMRLEVLKKQAQEALVHRNPPKKEDQERGIESNEIVVQERKEYVTLLGRIMRLIVPEIPALVGVLVTAIGAAATSLMMPVVTGELVNAISMSLTSSEYYGLVIPAQKLLGLFIGNGILTWMHVYLVSLFGENVALRLKSFVFGSIIHQDIEFFEYHKSGELVTRVTSDINEFKSVLKQVVTQGLKALTLTIGTAIQLVRISPQLTFFLSISMPFAYLGLWIYGGYLRKLRAAGRFWEEIEVGIASETISNIRAVRAFSAENEEMNLYKSSSEMVALGNIDFGFHMGVFRGLTNLSVGGLVLSVLYFGGNLVSRGDITAGSLMAYMMSVQQSQKALDSLGVLMGQTVKALASANRVFELTKIEPKIDQFSGIRLANLDGNVRFMDVTFAYPTRPDQYVLENFDLTINKGEVVALCGQSGSGKSTVGALLERMYEPSGGIIWIDGYPLSKVEPNWFRQQIGMIEQQPILFATTILENIRYGKPTASDEEVYLAAKMANAFDFISTFPRKFDTIVGEQGITLSGGQKQRIAIARAILRDPKILILDEATSALDSQSEFAVQQALEKLMVGKTVLIIAHRLSTIKNADKIVVMGQPQNSKYLGNELQTTNGLLNKKKSGQIFEIGTHEELMKAKGVYYKMYNQATENKSSTLD
ncbi:hypothetical protein BB558_004710 [Smittium angustum]|nr:hypothetical protein BB558_004710 [Smittium angustum]